MLLIWRDNEPTAYACILTKVSSTYRSHIYLDVGGGAVERAVFSKCSLSMVKSQSDQCPLLRLVILTLHQRYIGWPLWATLAIL